MTDVDVVVAGAGAGGLAAALRAAQLGADVLIVEADPLFRQGCNTAMSTGMIPAGGSRWQAAASIEDSPDGFLSDVLAKTGGAADPVVARALVDVAPQLVAWLADSCGVPLELVTDFRYPGHSALRCHSVPSRSGGELHAALLEAVARTGIDLLVPARLADVDLEGDRVRAAALRRPDGARERVTARSVVLASNGFGADPGLVADHIPEMAGARYHGGAGSTGDAVRLAGRHGLDLADLDAYQGHGSVAVPHAILLTWAVVMHGGVVVNAAGERFGDETVGYSEYAARVRAQPDGRAWVIFDERIDAACRPFKDYADVLAADAVRWAADLDALTAATGADGDRLAATLDAAGSAARGELGDRFGRTDWAAPLAPPYAAVMVGGALFHTQGGLRVDPSARVLRGGEPVPGLHAVGGAAVGMSGSGADGYLAGNGLLSALGLGYLAGGAA